jgi:hypothetical protein
MPENSLSNWRKKTGGRQVQINRQISAVDAKLKASLTREPDLAASFDVLVSIPASANSPRSRC